MTATAIIVGMSLVAALGLWIRWLYARQDSIPDLRAVLKITADRRDEFARQLAESRATETRLRGELRTALETISSISATLRKETDARIHASPADPGTQLRIADELLGRPWPEDDHSSGADGDREGGAGEAVSPTGAATETPFAWR